MKTVSSPRSPQRQGTEGGGWQLGSLGEWLCHQLHLWGGRGVMIHRKLVDFGDRVVIT